MNKKPPWAAWKIAGTIRRIILLLAIAIPTFFAANIMYSILPHGKEPILSVVMTALFGVLFAWISVGFWSSLAGFVLLLWGKDKYLITSPLPLKGEGIKLPGDFKTAILFPVYNEDPHMVAAGVKTLRKALKEAGEDKAFDVFVLSDSTQADSWAAEEEVFLAALQEDSSTVPDPKVREDGDYPLGGMLYYRHRQFNLKRKSGNIADFLRRWGAQYRYMIVFDADSLMSADCLTRLVLSMEARPDVGIIQTPPKAIFSRTLLAKVQQFANHFYGPVFAAGLHFWQLGDAQYWGHNAIIRVTPFMEHCQLARLSGHSAFGGEILSHDFVESALMRRAGYGVWLAYDMEGSWEMTPPTLVDELVRDRRWCQGNLQHTKLIFTRGFFPTHRALFINGIMSYGSALLWFFFLLASTFEALSAIIAPPDYFPEGPSLFPDWPKYFPTWALALLSSTGVLLFLPKLLAFFYHTLAGNLTSFGGFLRVSFSILTELIISTLLAPVRMLFHSYFVVTTLFNIKVSWNPQNRESSKGLPWGTAIRFLWLGSFLGLIWGLSMYIFSPGFFLWLSPVAIGLLISIPLSVYTSRISLGKAAENLGLLLTPAETRPAKEILELKKGLASNIDTFPFNVPAKDGFTRTVISPLLLSFHLHVFARKRGKSEQKAKKLEELIYRALDKGPSALSNLEKRELLTDGEAIKELHKGVWLLTGEKARPWRL
ncbi:MAG: glucans biosynthesis glucosyltransferase MdoH [Deltaproteobacteria bacterium]|nr:glucans biosynthesis glucosyltransferase MdoH [Deltaproteobacteria bacterium]